MDMGFDWVERHVAFAWSPEFLVIKKGNQKNFAPSLTTHTNVLAQIHTRAQVLLKCVKADM